MDNKNAPALIWCDILTNIGTVFKMNRYIKYKGQLYEAVITEAKADIDNFINKFGQDTYDLFQKSKDRLKNNKLSTDIVWHTKNTSPEEMKNMLTSLQRKTGNTDKSKVDFSKEQIRGEYKYLGEQGGYKIYQPLDYLASMDLGVNTGWCTTGRYTHYGDPNFQPSEKDAKMHFDNYTRKGIKFYYLLDPKTMYGKIAVAVYPETKTINYQFDNGDKIISTNAELFTDDDKQDFSLIAKLPQKVKDLVDIDIIYAKQDFPNKAKVNVTSVDLLSLEEVETLPLYIRRYKEEDWWLRSPGEYDGYAALVTRYGNVGFIGDDAFERHAVRPAFTIPSLKSLNLSIGEEVLLGEDQMKCIVISDDKVLYNDEITKSRFELSELFNDGDNPYDFFVIRPRIDYETSYIKNRVIDVLFKDDLGEQTLYY